MALLQDDKWLTDLTVSNGSFSFRIDTFFKYNIIVKSEFDSLASNNKVELQKSNRTVQLFSIPEIKCIVSVNLPVRYNDKVYNVKFEDVVLDQENIICGKIAECVGFV